MKTRHVVGFVGASLLTMVAADASADATVPQNSSAVVVNVVGGNEGRLAGEMRLRGPGVEQPRTVTLQKDGKQYVVVAYMLSMDENTGYGPWQCACSSYELQPNAAPIERASKKLLSTYKGNGERLCNHPVLSTDGDVIVFGYGSDYKSNNPNSYVGVIDNMCNVVTQPVMMNAKSVAELPPGSGITATDNNVPTDTIQNNDGALDISYNGNGQFTGGYLSTRGNATQAAYAFGIKLAKADVNYTVTRNWINPVIGPTNIGRPTVQAIDATRSIMCAADGENRPASKGVTCTVVDATTGNVRWKNLIAAAYRDTDQNGGGMHYFGQPTLAKLSDTSYALNIIESNGAGQGTNMKGTNLAHLYTLDLAADALQTNGHATGVAAFQTHSAICSGAFGVEGKTHVGVISAAPTGLGRSAMVFVDYDSTNKQFIYNDNLHTWPATWFGDSGYMANRYGRNPMRQGRDFLRCMGDVPNPGYHVDGGYMKDVKSFFVTAVPGRVPGDYKNSLFLSFIPGQADQTLMPQNPQPADQPPVPTTDNTGNQNNNAPSSSSGCACSTPGTSTDSGTMLGGLALVGLVIGATRRRTKKA